MALPPAVASTLVAEAAASASLQVDFAQASVPDHASGAWPAFTGAGLLLVNAHSRVMPARLRGEVLAPPEGGQERLTGPRPRFLVRFPERVFDYTAPPDLSPVTSEDTANDPVRYRIAGTLATATGKSAIYNGATAVAEFSPGPNDGFQPSRWQWGRCRTGLSRC